MATDGDDMADELMLDGNAVAGELAAVFGADMTANDAECASCGQVHAVGAMLAFTLGPGIVLRCPSCESVMVKIARTPRGIYIDARGAVYMRMPAA